MNVVWVEIFNKAFFLEPRRASPNFVRAKDVSSASGLSWATRYHPWVRSSGVAKRSNFGGPQVEPSRHQ